MLQTLDTIMFLVDWFWGALQSLGKDYRPCRRACPQCARLSRGSRAGARAHRTVTLRVLNAEWATGSERGRKPGAPLR